jgi:flagellar biosynthesis protein FliQ
MKKMVEMIKEIKDYDTVDKCMIIGAILMIVVLIVALVVTIVIAINGNLTTTEHNTVIVPNVTPIIRIILPL